MKRPMINDLITALVEFHKGLVKEDWKAKFCSLLKWAVYPSRKD